MSRLSCPDCPVPAGCPLLVPAVMSRLFCPVPDACPDFLVLPLLSGMFCSGYPVLAVLSRLSGSRRSGRSSPVTTVMSWLSYPGCSFPTVLSSLFSPGCPVLAVLSWLFCLGCPVLAVLSWLSCPGCPVPTACPDCPVLDALSGLSCADCPVLAVLL